MVELFYLQFAQCVLVFNRHRYVSSYNSTYYNYLTSNIPALLLTSAKTGCHCFILEFKKNRLIWDAFIGYFFHISKF